MPIYEYRCRKCGNEFELMRRITQMDAQAPCPACRSKATGRKISTFVIAGRVRPDPTFDDAEPDEYDLEPSDHSHDDDWADY
jgi:putative FmdB family regulatory protein